MSDELREELRAARGHVRAATARLRAQADEAAARLAQLEPELARVRAEAAAARAAGPSAHATEYETLRRDFEARVAALQGERALCEQALQDLRGEERALERADREVLIAPVRAVLAPDPFARSVEDVALGHVRGAAAELDADALLAAELAPAAPGLPAGGAPAPAAPAPAPPRSPEEQARAELAALKARRGPGGGKKTM